MHNSNLNIAIEGIGLGLSSVPKGRCLGTKATPKGYERKCHDE